jgi:hypothetical protein
VCWAWRSRHLHVARLPRRGVIAKPLIEADAMSGQTPPPDLHDRVVLTLWGYLTAKVPLA